MSECSVAVVDGATRIHGDGLCVRLNGSIKFLLLKILVATRLGSFCCTTHTVLGSALARSALVQHWCCRRVQIWGRREERKAQIKAEQQLQDASRIERERALVRALSDHSTVRCCGVGL